MPDSNRIWIPRIGQGRDTPVRAGLSRALAQIFPPIVSDKLPKRMKAAVDALAECKPSRWMVGGREVLDEPDPIP
jgi:hypothetical protein